MRHEPRPRSRLLALGAVLVLGFGLLSCESQTTSPSPAATARPSVGALAVQPQQAALEKARKAKDEHAARLMARPDVVGVGVGLTDDGRPAVVLLAGTNRGPGLPRVLDGVPVRVLVTGPLRAIPPARPLARGGIPGPPGGNDGGGNLRTTDYWPRPVPIGVSTGNRYECAAGTISARVTTGNGPGGVYALSNNHVYARENDASSGEAVVQPGLYDTQCSYDGSYQLGTLAAWIPIDFSGSASNIVDAAIASTTTSALGKATPADGYGTPGSTPVSAALGMHVQKYGRTTQLTRGVVTVIDAMVFIGYSSGTARFVDQVIVESNKPFIKPGDSGSLLVTDDASANPVGLMFAADNSGKWAIANPIDEVLSALHVSIDGKS